MITINQGYAAFIFVVIVVLVILVWRLADAHALSEKKYRDFVIDQQNLWVPLKVYFLYSHSSSSKRKQWCYVYIHYNQHHDTFRPSTNTEIYFDKDHEVKSSPLQIRYTKLQGDNTRLEVVGGLYTFVETFPPDFFD